VGEVFLAALSVDLAEVADALFGEPVQVSGELGEPAAGGVQVQRGAVGAGQGRHRVVPRGEHGQDQFLGDQPPAMVDDGGEVEPPVDSGHLVRQADHLGEVPHVVVEHRTPCRLGQGQARLAADVGAGENRPERLRGAEQPGGHRVDSSGRRGSSPSRSPTPRLASASTAGS
jgi:hypothetical protein